MPKVKVSSDQSTAKGPAAEENPVTPPPKTLKMELSPAEDYQKYIISSGFEDGADYKQLELLKDFLVHAEAYGAITIQAITPTKSAWCLEPHARGSIRGSIGPHRHHQHVALPRGVWQRGITRRRWKAIGMGPYFEPAVRQEAYHYYRKTSNTTT